MRLRKDVLRRSAARGEGRRFKIRRGKMSGRSAVRPPPGSRRSNSKARQRVRTWRRPIRLAGTASFARAPRPAETQGTVPEGAIAAAGRASMLTLSRWHGHLLNGMMTAAGLLLLAMTVMIGADVLFRNIAPEGFRRATNYRRTASISSPFSQPPPVAPGAPHPCRHRAARRAAAPRLASGVGWRRRRARLLPALCVVWPACRGRELLRRVCLHQDACVAGMWLLAPMPWPSRCSHSVRLSHAPAGIGRTAPARRRSFGVVSER